MEGGWGSGRIWGIGVSLLPSFTFPTTPFQSFSVPLSRFLPQTLLFQPHTRIQARFQSNTTTGGRMPIDRGGREKTPIERGDKGRVSALADRGLEFWSCFSVPWRPFPRSLGTVFLNPPDKNEITTTRHIQGPLVAFSSRYVVVFWRPCSI